MKATESMEYELMKFGIPILFERGRRLSRRDRSGDIEWYVSQGFQFNTVRIVSKANEW